MMIGVPRETHRHEHRVGLSPEYGVAHLFGRNLRQRAEALIRIAHPEFRADLEAAARERKLIP